MFRAAEAEARIGALSAELQAARHAEQVRPCPGQCRPKPKYGVKAKSVHGYTPVTASSRSALDDTEASGIFQRCCPETRQIPVCV